MRFIKKWVVHQKSRFTLKRKPAALLTKQRKKKSEITSNMHILNNHTHHLDQSYDLTENTLPTDYQHSNCVCLFIMLVFYYISILATKLKVSLQENINKHK